MARHCAGSKNHDLKKRMKMDNMLTSAGCLERRTRLWELLPDHIEWVLIGDPRHVQYFSNFRIQPLSFSAEQNCLLWINRRGQATLLADNFVRRTAMTDPVVDDEVITAWYTHKKSVTNRQHALLAAVNERSADWSAENGLLEVEAIPMNIGSQFAASAIGVESESGATTLGTLIRQLRRQKHDDEVQQLKLCMQAGEAGQAAALEAASMGATELDVFLAIQQAAQRQAGCAAVVYGDFRATNRKRHKAGGLPSTETLNEGDLLILDFSVVLHGYRSDFTNTISIGSPADDVVRQFEACRDALLAAEATLKAGVDCKDVYEAATTVFTERHFPALPHHCGHGLGLEHPEAPILVPESTDTLQVGDVVTIEPGQYVEGVGGMRFEHNYLIESEGSQRLSHHELRLN